jgi:hypothetical protein
MSAKHMVHGSIKMNCDVRLSSFELEAWKKPATIR